MTYTKSYTAWQDYPNTTTPATAAKLQNIDDGVSNAVERAGDTMTGRLSLGASGSGYIVDSNSHVTTPGGYYGFNAYLARTGGGLISDATVGYRVNVTDTGAASATVTNVTATTPIVVTTSAAHGYTNGTVVAVGSVSGITAANGKWTVTSAGSATFSLSGSVGSGAYTSGGKVTSAGSLYGASIAVSPTVTRVLGSFDVGAAAFGDDVVGCGVYNAGTAKASAGFNVGGSPSPAWGEGIGIDASTDFGISFTNLGTHGTGIGMGGTFTDYGIDFAFGTYSASAMMRLKNQTYVVGRNAAGSANINLFRVNSLDELQFHSGTRFSSTTVMASLLYFDEGINIQVGTSTGTKIGTSSSQKLGFWNATPVVRPSAYTPTNVTADRSYDANSTSIDEIADVLGTLITDLQTVGLIG